MMFLGGGLEEHWYKIGTLHWYLNQIGESPNVI